MLPVSYSRVIPSFAISAALNWAVVASKTPFDELYVVQAFAVSMFTWSDISLKRSCFSSTVNFAFFTEDRFFPPLKIGHLTVAFTSSLSLSSTVVLMS